MRAVTLHRGLCNVGLKRPFCSLYSESLDFQHYGWVPLVKIQIRISNPKMDFLFLWANPKKDFESIESTLRNDSIDSIQIGIFRILNPSVPLGMDSKKVLMVSGVYQMTLFPVSCPAFIIAWHLVFLWLKILFWIRPKERTLRLGGRPGGELPKRYHMTRAVQTKRTRSPQELYYLGCF